MDFSDLASRYMDARLGPVTQMFTNPGQAMTDRISNDLGVDVTGANVKPKSTTVNYNEDGTQDVTHKFNVGAPPTVAPSASTAGQGLGPDFAQYQAPPSAGAGRGFVNPPTQPTPQQIPQTTAPAPQQTAQGQQQTAAAPQAVPPSMSGMPSTPGAGMFPQGAQPIASGNQPQPMDNLSAIQQIESGGNNAAVGAAGETGAMQVMPTSLKNPGYGVKPARDNTPEEANRVGRDYYTAMLNRYQDPVLAAAAYNAGPGTMDRAIARSSQEGGHPMAYMPNSTQEYAAKFARLTGHAPGQTDNPNTREPWKLTNTGMIMPGDKVSEQHEDLNAARGNPQKLTALATSDEATPAVKAHAADELTNHFEDIKKTNTAAKTVDAGLTGADLTSSQKLASALNPNSKPTEEGSYIKAYLFHRFGLEDLARQEQEKISPTSTYQSVTGPDGNDYSIRVSKDGQILGAKDSAGADADAKTIASLQANHIDQAQLKTLQTQAHQSAAKQMDAMRKENVAAQNAQLPPRYTDQEIIEGGRNAYTQTMGVTRGGLKAAPAGMAQPTTTVGKPATTTTSEDKYATSPTLAGWRQQKVGEDIKAYKKRMEINPDEVDQTAQGLYNGDIQTSDITGRDTNFKRLATERAIELGKEKGVAYNSGEFKRIQANKSAWDKGPQSKQVQQFDRAASHAVSMGPVIDALNNTNSPLYNAAKNKFESLTGGTAPADFDTAKQIVGDEVVKTVLGGTSAVADRKGLQEQFDNAKTGPQLHAVLERAKELMAAQATAMERQYKSTTKQNDFNEKLGPAGQQILGRGHASDRNVAAQNVQKNMPSQDEIAAEIERRKKAKQ